MTEATEVGPERNEVGEKRLSWWVVVTAVTPVLLGFVVFLVVLPALPLGGRESAVLRCGKNLQRIGCAIALYQNHFDEWAMPESLEAAVRIEGFGLEVLECPGSDDKVGECSYVYRGVDLGESAPKDMVVAYNRLACRGGRRYVLFVDLNNVEPVWADRFAALIAEDNRLRREMGLAEKAIGE